MKKRSLSVLLAITMISQMMTTTAFATEATTIGTGDLCEHHTAHDETCGYKVNGSEADREGSLGSVEGTEETPCTHVHDENCCTILHSDDSDSEATPSDADEPSEHPHECGEESGCIIDVSTCTHEHDESCGYAPAVEGQPCQYECTECEEEPETPAADSPAPVIISEWSWADEWEIIDPETGIAMLVQTGSFDEVVSVLPAAIIYGEEKEIDIESWTCDDFEELAGSYIFTAALPDGYQLDNDADPLTLTVEMGEGSLFYNTSGHTHCFCGGVNLPNPTHNCSNSAWTAWSAVPNSLNDGVTYAYLAYDITTTSAIRIESGQTLYLCLNGHKLSNTRSSAFWIRGGGKLHLTDCRSANTTYYGQWNGDTYAIQDNLPSSETYDTLPGGIVTGNASAVGIENSGHFYLYKGNIAGSIDTSLERGGGVFIKSGGTFTMYGGMIVGNKSTVDSQAGGIYNAGSFNMYSGSIINNKATANASAGGVYVINATTNIFGGKISGNTAPVGGSSWTAPKGTGGIRTDYGSALNISGGEISGNKGSTGGINCGGTFKLSGNPKITDNHAGTDTDVNSNVQLNGSPIEITTPFATDPIGIQTSLADKKLATWSITDSSDYSSNFFSEESGYGIKSYFTDDKNYLKAVMEYDVIRSEIANGTLAVNKLAAVEGSCITITATPGLGYKMGEINVKRTDDNSNIDLSGSGNTRTFTMPASDVTIDVEFVSCEHTGGTATCISPAICTDCGQTYGSKDLNNHAGGTELRGQVSATTTSTGYTGDTYCLGCGTKTATGTTIPKINSGVTAPSAPGSGNSRPSAPSYEDDSSSGSSADIPSAPPAPSAPSASPVVPVTVPVSGDENSIQVKAELSGTTATVDHVDFSALNTVIGNHVDNIGVVTIDFSGLDNKEPLTTVAIPSDIIQQIAKAVNDPGNDAKSLEIIFSDGISIEFDAAALGAKAEQTNGLGVYISVKPSQALDNIAQNTVLNDRPAYDVTVISGDKPITNFGGEITIQVPYELREGEDPKGIAVWYVDDSGKKELCVSSYDSEKKLIRWKTDHLSLYMIGYDGALANLATNSDTAADANANLTHIVKRGDTLWLIAKKYGSTVSGIAAANSNIIKNPNLIHIGWELQIPKA